MSAAREWVRVAQAGKERDPGWYRVHRRLSIHVTALALRLGVRASTCSLLMMAFALAGAVAVAVRSPWANAAGFALGYGAFLLDKVDGEIARCRGEASARGVLLDRFHHRVIEPALFLGVGVHEWRMFGSLAALVAGFVTAQLANAIEETQQLPPFILDKRLREGAPLPAGTAPAPDPRWSAAARLLKPLKVFRTPITALPLYALCYLAEAATGRPVPGIALLVSAVGLAAFLVVQTIHDYHGRLDQELARVASTWRDAAARGRPPRTGG